MYRAEFGECGLLTRLDFPKVPLLSSTQARRSAIPIAIALRNQFSASYYRDSIVRALRAQDIDCAYIASGFFTDFTIRLEDTAPDFGIDEEMEGKRVVLLGGFNEDPKELRELRDALIQRGVEAQARTLPSPERGEIPLRWHAKVAVFLSDSKPVLAIVGSSNFSGPTMVGGSEHKFIASPGRVQVEADSFYWLRSHMDADQAVHDAFHYWGSGRLAPHIAFNHEKFDEEIEKLIESTYSRLQSFSWRDV
ncbi:phospholipase D family protein [Burkholderia stagnalis]|uniref:phospholipase D family protein n=1 Tax=Burkholderia stagnalis TaxID=1503054 RepID=UPI000F5B664B|nr:phospholipase D family protein [Burkholderia stagnalis]